MNFIKKNLFLLGSCIVFILGSGLFVFGTLLRGEIRDDLASVGKEQKRIVDLRSQVVPNNELERLRKTSELADEDVGAIREMALKTAQRPLIYDEVFPQANATYYLAKYKNFGTRYTNLVDHLLVQLNAGTPPSEVEIDRATDEFNEKSQNATGGRGEKDQLEKLIRDIYKQRSDEITLYARPHVFFGYDFWKHHQPGKSLIDDMEADSWYTQIAQWIQEDVVQAVAQINAGSQKVSNSTVKRLLEVSFGGRGAKSKYDSSGLQGRNKDNAATRRRAASSQLMLPEYVTKVGDTYNGEMATAWTMRASDDKMDVVQFEVGVIIDTRRINDFINTLQEEKYTLTILADGTTERADKRNQITVLQVLQDPVFFEDEIEAGYHYGSASVCVLRLICEYIFFREGYQDDIPTSVKDLLEMSRNPVDKKK